MPYFNVLHIWSRLLDRFFFIFLKFLIAFFLTESRNICFLCDKVAQIPNFPVKQSIWDTSLYGPAAWLSSWLGYIFFSHIPCLLLYWIPFIFAGVHPQVIFLSKIVWKGNLLSLYCLDVTLFYIVLSLNFLLLLQHSGFHLWPPTEQFCC